MEQHSRDEIVASAAAHAELGPGYENAVAEGLVERIGTEIDKRVDARFASHDRRRTVSRGGPASWQPVAMGLGSVALGTAATVAVLHPWAGYPSSGGTLTLPAGRVVQLPGLALRPGAGTAVTGGQVALVALIWLIIAVIYVAYTRQHGQRRQRREPPRYLADGGLPEGRSAEG
jgi:hypothetical protein